MSVLFDSSYNVREQVQQDSSYRFVKSTMRRQQQPSGSRAGEKRGRNEEEDLLVFGYACQIFYDDEKAMFFEEGKHLIPWMGDKSLMIDRYDGRLLLEDLSQFLPQASSNQPQFSNTELELELQCDKERYLALEENLLDVEQDEEEEMKRFKAAIASEGSYGEVQFNYGEQQQPQTMYNYKTVDSQARRQTLVLPHYYPYIAQAQEPVAPDESTTSFQDEPSPAVEEPEEEIEVFVPPAELGIPTGMDVPDTAKLHAIIERTAFFIKDHGAQMEIVVKAKQSGNPQFGFLHFDHELNPYYKLILKAIRDGSYEAMCSKPASPTSPEREEDSEDSDDDNTELHPLLTASLRTPITRRNGQTSANQPLPPGWTAVTAAGNSSRNTHYPNPGIDGFTMTPSHMTLLPPPLLPPPPLPPGLALPSFDPTMFGGMPTQSPALLPHTMPPYLGGNMQAPPIIPPPPDLKPICDKLAEYVARNGDEFEGNIKAKGDPRFDFLHETSDLHAYYLMKRDEFKQNPTESSSSPKSSSQASCLMPSDKPVSFQIKAKDKGKHVLEYRNSVLFKTAKADESEEEDGEEEDEGAEQSEENKGSSEADILVAGPKTMQDALAEERATKLKEEKEKEVQRLEEDAKSTTSSLHRQVQLERRRRAQLFINMLKKTKGSSEQAAATASNQTTSSSEPK